MTALRDYLEGIVEPEAAGDLVDEVHAEALELSVSRELLVAVPVHRVRVALEERALRSETEKQKLFFLERTKLMFFFLNKTFFRQEKSPETIV